MRSFRWGIAPGAGSLGALVRGACPAAVALATMAALPCPGSAQVDTPPAVAPDAVPVEPVTVDPAARSISFPATLQLRAFAASSPPDERYHALVHDEGGAASKALLVTSVPDTRVARLLREFGADDAGGVPMAAWTLRWMPLIPQPGHHHTRGTQVEVWIHWAGASRPYALGELLGDTGGQGVTMRFAGNEEHDDTWRSGCILCLFSCPGGVVSNAAYSIRDHHFGETRFDPGDELPPDGTAVTVTLSLAPG